MLRSRGSVDALAVQQDGLRRDAAFDEIIPHDNSLIETLFADATADDDRGKQFGTIQVDREIQAGFQTIRGSTIPFNLVPENDANIRLMQIITNAIPNDQSTAQSCG